MSFWQIHIRCMILRNAELLSDLCFAFNLFIAQNELDVAGVGKVGESKKFVQNLQQILRQTVSFSALLCYFYHFINFFFCFSYVMIVILFFSIIHLLFQILSLYFFILFTTFSCCFSILMLLLVFVFPSFTYEVKQSKLLFIYYYNIIFCF